MSKKSIKLDSYVWLAKNGSIGYGFYFGEASDPIQFSTSLKELVRDTLEAYRIPAGGIPEYHLEDMKLLSRSLQAARNLIDHEVKRLEGNEEND